MRIIDSFPNIINQMMFLPGRKDRKLPGLPVHEMPSSSVLLALGEKIADTLSNTLGCENMKKVYQMLLAGTIGTEAVKGYGRELYVLFYSILEKGIRCGELTSSLPLEALSRHFVMALRGVSYEWCVRYPDFDLREQAIEHIRLLIEGIQMNKTQ